jgi:hypothetical protein
MMSSALKLNVWVEFVTNASITDSSTPELTSLISSASDPVGLILGGTGLSLETTFTGASVSASLSASSAATCSDEVGSLGGATTGLVGGTVDSAVV